MILIKVLAQRDEYLQPRRFGAGRLEGPADAERVKGVKSGSGLKIWRNRYPVILDDDDNFVCAWISGHRDCDEARIAMPARIRNGFLENRDDSCALAR